MIKSDKWIKSKCIKPENSSDEFVPMITPFELKNIRYNSNGDKIISYGLSSFGYDVTLSDEFRIFNNVNNIVVDPLAFDEKCLHSVKSDICVIPPHSYALGITEQYFVIPKNVLVLCVGKSTYARSGAIVNITPIEPEFRGHIVIEISNSTSLPLKIYAKQGIAQFLFFESDEDCEVSYNDKNGKYQDQRSIVLAKG